MGVVCAVVLSALLASTPGGPIAAEQGHVHQVVFIVLSLAGLLLPVREFFRTGIATGAP